MKSLFLISVSLATICVQGQNYGDFKNTMDKPCPNFRCSSGYTPAPKSRTKFESTGCSNMGGGGMMLNAAGGGTDEKPYESCCDQWHACYQICGVSKKTCDATFETCAKESCDSQEDSDKCTKDFLMSNMMIKMGGCKRFDESQYQSCECAPSDQASEKREAAIRYFYKKYAPENVEKSKALAAKADTPSKLAGLFVKLLGKYPEAIVKKENPMKGMFDKINMDQAEKDTADEEEGEESDGNDQEEEEKIEL